jgi:hypothetical protein
MNRCVWVCVGLLFGFAIAVHPVRGQDLPSETASSGLAPNIKNATNADSYAKDIRAFIQDQVTLLQAPDDAGQTQARDKLIAQCSTRSSVSPSFATVYSREWANAAKPLMALGNPMRLRLNVAIVTAELAENGRSLELEPISEQILGDREGCIILWGIRTARALIPIILQQPSVIVSGKSVSPIAASKLIAALVNAVKSHGSSDLSGFLTLDAYRALIARDIPGMTEDDIKRLTPPLVVPVLAILEFRLAQYAKGAIPMPDAEREVTTFLSSNYAAVPAEQQRIVEDLVQLVTYAGQRSSLYASSKQDMSRLRDMLINAAQALNVIANNPGVASGLIWLRQIPPSASPTDIDAHTSAVWQTLNLVFQKLPKPPAIPTITAPPPTPSAGVSGKPATSPPAPR